MKNDLDEYLAELQKFFGCKVSYFGSDKKRFQIDIPESHTKKVTSEYQLEGTKKGAKPSKRYSTNRSRVCRSGQAGSGYIFRFVATFGRHDESGKREG